MIDTDLTTLTDATLTDAQRERLVRLCTHITGDAGAADDLAQESLIEAWRSRNQLRDPQALDAWLAGIARNVCRRWQRRQQHANAHQLSGETPDLPDDRLPDLQLELERDYLAQLLDRALAALPAKTRQALLLQYVEGHAQSEVAQQLGLSAGAVAMRLQRGKLALRRILETDLRADAMLYGLIDGDADRWQPTRIWCAMCGTHRLEGRFAPDAGTLVLRCPDCFARFGLHDVQSWTGHTIFDELKTPTAAYRHLHVFADAFHRRALEDNTAPCHACGAPTTVHRELPATELPRLREAHGMHLRCTGCQETFHVSLSGLVLSLPAAREFRRQYGRILAHSELEITFQGRAALRTHIASLATSDTLEVISDAATLAVLGIFANGQPVSS